jgi:hypothetical protein
VAIIFIDNRIRKRNSRCSAPVILTGIVNFGFFSKP